MPDALTIVVEAMAAFFKGSRGVKEGTFCVHYMIIGPDHHTQLSVKYGDCPTFKGVML